MEWRSERIKRSAPDKIGNVNKSIQDVINRLHENNVIVFNVKEYVLRFRKVIKKLIDVRHEDNPDINNENTRKRIDEGDKEMNEVDRGGYNVHPVPPPNSIIIDNIKIRYENKRINIEKLLTLG